MKSTLQQLLFLVLVIISFSCTNDSESNSTSEFSDTGQGGSLARFAINGDYLYVVDNFDLNVFNITNPEDPVQVNSVGIGFDIETLFGYNEYLYIGSRNGMFIYSVDNPEEPSYLSEVQHFTACDPVVANDNYAFVTLHSNTLCGTDINVLEIYDVTDTTSPILLSRRNLIRPIGIGLYGDYLFVCDDEVKVFDVSDPTNSVLVNSININTFDVIVNQDKLILIGEGGLYQYQLNPNNIEEINFLSTINI